MNCGYGNVPNLSFGLLISLELLVSEDMIPFFESFVKISQYAFSTIKVSNGHVVNDL